MTQPTVGELFAGYGGIYLALRQLWPDAQLAWVSDNDPHATTVLAHHHPHAPNHGDITTIDWATVQPVDILTGGFPCQDLSIAGQRRGLRPGTRSGLWAHMAYAIDQLRPPLVVVENVRGLLSAPAHSDLEPCPWCVGDHPDRALRALGAVLGDLAELRYDASWCGLRAADVGAPHGRYRIFLVAWPAADPEQGGRRRWPPDPLGRPLRGTVAAWGGQDVLLPTHLLPTPKTNDHGSNSPGDRRRNDPGLRTLPDLLLPTPRATDGTKGGPNQRGSAGDLMLPSAVTLLPTPAVNDMGGNKTPQEWDEWTARMKTIHHNGIGHGPSLAVEVQRDPTHWGAYADAIHRWETLTRPAPPPTEPGRNGPRLSARFAEWMMGLPPGHVTDHVSRNPALHLCGNGVVPQQTAAAIHNLLHR